MPLLCFNWGLAGRCAHKTPAIGGRFPHLRPEKCKLSRTWKSAKRRQWRMKRAGFEEVARLARPKGRGNRNATTVTSEKTIQIYFASADAKVCDAGACFLPVRAENAAGTRWEIVRGFRVRGPVRCLRQRMRHGRDFACLPPEAANAAGKITVSCRSLLLWGQSSFLRR